MRLAEALQEWIHDVIQSVECFYSSDDIRAGQRWNAEINTQLAETDFGLLCVTAENLTAPWLNFEAGALSKKVDESRVVPITLGFPPSRLEDPLKQFNGVEANQEGMKKLVGSIAEVAKTQINLDRTFDRWWPDLEAKINAIPGTDEDVEVPQPPDAAEVLEEILGIVRGISNDIRADKRERRLSEARRDAINRMAIEAPTLTAAAELNEILSATDWSSATQDAWADIVRKMNNVEALTRLLREVQRQRQQPGKPGSTVIDDESPGSD